MQRYFLIDKNNNQVVSFSEDKTAFSNPDFKEVKIDTTASEEQKLNEGGYFIYYLDKTLTFEKTPIVIKEELKKEVEVLQKKIEAGTITEQEKNQLLLKLIKANF